MRQIYKLDKIADAQAIRSIEEKLVEYSNSDNPKFREMASWETVIFNGYLYERTVGGEIWRVVMT